MTPVTAHVVALVACAICGGPLAEAGGTLRCPAGHAFDVARQGYASLLPGDAPPGGDTAAMVAAREAFLSAGHYAPLAEAVAAAAVAASNGVPGAVVEVGAGPGAQLAMVLDRLPDRIGLAVDRSAAACRRAARAHPRMGAVVADVWRGIPVRDDAAAVVIDVFAPRNGAEMRRILHAGGALVVASPTPRHLAELVEPLGLLEVDDRKEERIEAALGSGWRREAAVEVEARLALPHADVELLVAMGPSAWHARGDEMAERIRALPDPAPTTLSATVATYRVALGV
ncbi:MAG: rRNA (guanine745-N1)-methyltransferase [Miltoncostaeaceae bacterium]|jgi:23S rRNA (guanine745-N1)-methyltransferase|nr:rRNA (guanine745-N1)-methyltransferase [Miltoncostaeaceae bacterium]